MIIDYLSDFTTSFIAKHTIVDKVQTSKGYYQRL